MTQSPDLAALERVSALADEMSEKGRYGFTCGTEEARRTSADLRTLLALAQRPAVKLDAERVTEIAKRNIYRTARNGPEDLCSRIAKEVVAYAAECAPVREVDREEEKFLEFCARHLSPVRRMDLSDAELISIIEHHPVLKDALQGSSKSNGGEAGE